MFWRRTTHHRGRVDAIYNARNEITAILNGRDDRLLALAGPCSIHDTKAAREYAGLLKGAIDEFPPICAS